MKSREREKKIFSAQLKLDEARSLSAVALKTTLLSQNRLKSTSANTGSDEICTIYFLFYLQRKQCAAVCPQLKTLTCCSHFGCQHIPEPKLTNKCDMWLLKCNSLVSQPWGSTHESPGWNKNPSGGVNKVKKNLTEAAIAFPANDPVSRMALTSLFPIPGAERDRGVRHTERFMWAARC